MNFIDAHVHVWTDDTGHYPLARGYKKEDMRPAVFTPKELFTHTRPNGVERINLIQMSFYGFDNSYMLDAIAEHPKTFVGTAVIDPEANGVEKTMTDLGRRGVRAFRLHPRLTNAKIDRWLTPPGYAKMFAQAARNNQALSFLIDPDGLPEVERLGRLHPGTTVIIDHLARIGASGKIDDKDVDALCALAKLPRAYVKVGAFYALGDKKAPYTDLASLIEKVVAAYGAERCALESDCPFQVAGGHNYKDSIDLVKAKLSFLSARDREWLLRKTAERLFFDA